MKINTEKIEQFLSYLLAIMLIWIAWIILMFAIKITKEVSAKTIKTTVTVPKTVNMKTTVPLNNCNACLADTETREGREWCFERFCK